MPLPTRAVDSLDTLTYSFDGQATFADAAFWTVDSTQIPAQTTYTFPDSGTYELRFTAINRCDTLVWDSTLTIIFPKADTIISGLSAATAGVQLQIYPNPTAGRFTLTGATPLQHIEVWTLTGRRM